MQSQHLTYVVHEALFLEGRLLSPSSIKTKGTMRKWDSRSPHDWAKTLLFVFLVGLLFCLNVVKNLSMVIPSLNPNTQEAEVVGSLVGGQPLLCGNSLSQNKTNPSKWTKPKYYITATCSFPSMQSSWWLPLWSLFLQRQSAHTLVLIFCTTFWYCLLFGSQILFLMLHQEAQQLFSVMES